MLCYFSFFFSYLLTPYGTYLVSEFSYFPQPKKEPTEKENAGIRRPGLWGWEAKWILPRKRRPVRTWVCAARNSKEKEEEEEARLEQGPSSCLFSPGKVANVPLEFPLSSFFGGVPFSARPREIFRVLLQPDPTPGPASESFFFFDGLGSSGLFCFAHTQYRTWDDTQCRKGKKSEKRHSTLKPTSQHARNKRYSFFDHEGRN